MTLKEKDLVNTFYYSLPNNGSQEGINSTTRRYAEAQQCALIAEEFAIGFAEWCTRYHDKNRNVNGEMLHAKSKYDETYLTKELLEIYKKEKYESNI